MSTDQPLENDLRHILDINNVEALESPRRAEQLLDDLTKFVAQRIAAVQHAKHAYVVQATGSGTIQGVYHTPGGALMSCRPCRFSIDGDGKDGWIEDLAEAVESLEAGGYLYARKTGKTTRWNLVIERWEMKGPVK